MALELAGLVVEPPQCAKLLIAAQLRLLDGRLPHLDGLIENLERHRERMPVLAAVRKREPPGIAEPARGAVHDFGHHRQRADGPRAHARRQQQLGKIRRTPVGRRGQIPVQPVRDHVFGADVVVRRHHQVRQQRLHLRLPRGTFKPREFAHDPIRPQGRKQIELRTARSRRAPVGKVDDLALADAIDRSVRIVHKACQPLREPMIAACLPAFAVHALLHHGPVAVIGDDKTVQVEIEAVLHGGAIDLGHEAAGLRELAAVEAHMIPDRDEFARRLA